MPRKFFVFANVDTFTVRLATDFGWSGVAVPGTDPQGRPGQVLEIPDAVPQEGAQLNVDAAGKVPVQQRGILTYPDFDPTRAYLLCDDFVLVDVPEAPPPEPPIPPTPTPTDPLGIINAVYATGQYNLATHVGCGTFTEACVDALRQAYGQVFGHIRKTPGQNQYNAHAVDALQSIAGEFYGIWDIIVSSVSSSAHTAWNRVSDAKPELYCYPPASCVSATRNVRVTVDISLEDIALILAILKRQG